MRWLVLKWLGFVRPKLLSICQLLEQQDRMQKQKYHWLQNRDRLLRQNLVWLERHRPMLLRRLPELENVDRWQLRRYRLLESRYQSPLQNRHYSLRRHHQNQLKYHWLESCNLQQRQQFCLQLRRYLER